MTSRDVNIFPSIRLFLSSSDTSVLKIECSIRINTAKKNTHTHALCGKRASSPASG